MVERARPSRTRLLRRGLRLEYGTLGWNVIGVVVLAVAALGAGSPALGGFGLDSLIEIGASIVVVWQLRGSTRGVPQERGARRERVALRLIGSPFVLLTCYLTVQVVYTFAVGGRPQPSGLGSAWTAATAVVMLGLAIAKNRTGAALGNMVLSAEGRVTLVDALLAVAVLTGLALNAALGWWWADPAAGAVIAVYAAREAGAALSTDR